MSSYDYTCFFNRELSWLEFNRRVLDQATAPENPLGERLRFSAITLSNLDEFYMIRVASLKDQQHSGYSKKDISGMTPKEQLSAISVRVHELYTRIYEIYNKLTDELYSQCGIRLLTYAQLSEGQRRQCRKYFRDNIYPSVSPAVISRDRKSPFVPGKGLNVLLMLSGESGERFVTMQLPTSEGRLTQLPDSGKERLFVPVEELIAEGTKKLFPGEKVDASCVYRLTRNGDIAADAEEAEDLLSAVKKSLVRRKRGAVIRLETQHDPDKRLLRMLQKEFDVGDKGTFALSGPVDVGAIASQLASLLKKRSMRYPDYEPNTPAVLCSSESIFDVLRRGDILLHHPFDSFDPVVRLLSEAAVDPAVTAIKITLYRLSDNSPIVAALAKAAKKGKQVTAFIEARARFDEENNIEYGAELEKAGVTVIYGLPKYKTHSKIALVLRREDCGLRKYTHLGTGNYNDVTARAYTDFSLLTSSMSVGADGVEFFHSIAGTMREPDLEHLIMSPFSLRERLCDEINAQRVLARAGKPAAIFAKMNSLVDEQMISALYDASRDGVQIRLLVRGICCLRPGVEGLSENIEVRSVIGRFLEHSRVYCFGTPDTRKNVYLSSADWMPRNLSRRVELMFPLLSEDICAQVSECMELYWRDRVKARRLDSDGSYVFLPRSVGSESVDAQGALIALRCSKPVDNF